MRALGLVLAAGLLLAGCSSSWEDEVRFEVTKIEPGRESFGKVLPARVIMKLDQEKPDSSKVGPTEGADIDQFPADVAVGDKVTCTVRVTDGNGVDGVDPQTTIGPCRRP
jgi:hypothetical protein